jgi:tetratricopeptide (TPR) repeat protein
MRVMMRRVVVTGAVVSGLLLPGSADGQLARRASNERLLVMAPVPSGTDSAFAVETGEAIRDRMTSRYRMRIGIVPTTTICEALEASGFNCKVPLPPGNAPALARFLQATAYMVGWLDQGVDSLTLRLRMVDAAGSGLSGWETVRAPATMSAQDFGRLAADALDNQLKAAEFARDCNERRQRGDGKGAADRAGRAFALYPNHPSAAICLAFAFEVQQQPIDSIVVALRRAVTGDSLNGKSWEELGRRLRDLGDTTGALDAFRNQLRANPSDERLRLGVAAGLAAAGEFGDAVEVLDDGLVLNPGNLTMLQMKERICLDGTLWVCALEALEGQFDLDSTLVNDTIFFTKTFAAAQSVPDTTAMLRWSERAVTEFPDYVPAWRARAATLKLVDDRERVLEAYDRIVGLDSTQAGSALAAAQYLLDSTLVIDTAAPLDTARLLKAERLLLLAGSQISDTATSMAIATMFYNPASKISQMRMAPHLPLASRFLEHTLRYDLRGQLNGPANFFLGLALFFQITALDEQVRATQSCELVDVEMEMTRRARTALEAGRQISPATVQQLLGFVQQIQGALPTYKPVFKCPGA